MSQLLARFDASLSALQQKNLTVTRQVLTFSALLINLQAIPGLLSRLYEFFLHHRLRPV